MQKFWCKLKKLYKNMKKSMKTGSTRFRQISSNSAFFKNLSCWKLSFIWKKSMYTKMSYFYHKAHESDWTPEKHFIIFSANMSTTEKRAWFLHANFLIIWQNKTFVKFFWYHLRYHRNRSLSISFDDTEKS